MCVGPFFVGAVGGAFLGGVLGHYRHRNDRCHGWQVGMLINAAIGSMVGASIGMAVRSVC